MEPAANRWCWWQCSCWCCIGDGGSELQCTAMMWQWWLNESSTHNELRVEIATQATCLDWKAHRINVCFIINSIYKMLWFFNREVWLSCNNMEYRPEKLKRCPSQNKQSPPFPLCLGVFVRNPCCSVFTFLFSEKCIKSGDFCNNLSEQSVSRGWGGAVPAHWIVKQLHRQRGAT